jgi:hypothetical protein
MNIGKRTREGLQTTRRCLSAPVEKIVVFCGSERRVNNPRLAKTLPSFMHSTDPDFELFCGLFASAFNAFISIRLPLARFVGANQAILIGVQHTEVVSAGQELIR